MKSKEPDATQEEYTRCISRYRDIPLVELVPNVKAHILSGQKMTAIFVTLAPNSQVPMHHHEPEQIMIVVDGAGDEIIDGKLYPVKEGDVIVIASNQEHGTYVSAQGMRTVEVFSSVRQDYMAKLEAVKKGFKT